MADKSNTSEDQTWYTIDFGDVERLVRALETVSVFAYKVPVLGYDRYTTKKKELEYRVRIDIEGDKLWITGRNVQGSEIEEQHDLAYSPFGNPKFEHFPERIKPPTRVAFMTNPESFANFLKELGGKCQIERNMLLLKWQTPDILVVSHNEPVSSKRRPV